MIIRIEESSLAQAKNITMINEMQYALLNEKGLKPDEENLDDETGKKIEVIEQEVDSHTTPLKNRKGISYTSFVRRIK